MAQVRPGLVSWCGGRRRHGEVFGPQRDP